jgi:hypothetical protein
MPRTANREVSYYIEIDTEYLNSLGAKTYLQASDPQSKLEKIGDTITKILGFIREIQTVNRVAAEKTTKQYIMDFVARNGKHGTYVMFYAKEITHDFSGWTINILLRYLP